MTSASETCETILRSQDFDRWLACLGIDQGRRGAVHALYAFNAEVARIRESVREVLAGEIRLQYWRDVLENGQGDSPVAQGLLAAMQQHHLPTQPLLNLIDARVHDLYDDGFATLNDLEGYCGETCSVLFHLTGMVLGGADERLGAAAGHAGVAYAMSGLLAGLPITLARGQCFIPQDVLARHGLTRMALGESAHRSVVKQIVAELSSLVLDHHQQALRALEKLPSAFHPAFLPLCFVPDTVRALRANPDVARQVTRVTPWRKPFVLWCAIRRLK